MQIAQNKKPIGSMIATRTTAYHFNIDAIHMSTDKVYSCRDQLDYQCSHTIILLTASHNYLAIDNLDVYIYGNVNLLIIVSMLVSQESSPFEDIQSTV